jgi:hypothetical protein
MYIKKISNKKIKNNLKKRKKKQKRVIFSVPCSDAWSQWGQRKVERRWMHFSLTHDSRQGLLQVLQWANTLDLPVSGSYAATARVLCENLETLIVSLPIRKQTPYWWSWYRSLLVPAKQLSYKMAHSTGSENPKTKRKVCGQCENKAALLVSTLQCKRTRTLTAP